MSCRFFFQSRNKPKQPAKTYVAPFFLQDKVTPAPEATDPQKLDSSLKPPTRLGVRKNNTADPDEPPAKVSHFIDSSHSPFARALLETSTSGSSEQCKNSI